MEYLRHRGFTQDWNEFLYGIFQVGSAPSHLDVRNAIHRPLNIDNIKLATKNFGHFDQSKPQLQVRKAIKNIETHQFALDCLENKSALSNINTIERSTSARKIILNLQSRWYSEIRQLAGKFDEDTPRRMSLHQS